MNIGYARVSTVQQDLSLQHDALEAAGCEKVFWEEVSSKKADRPELARALEYCRQGDVFMVWRLDRLGRSVKELLEIVNGLQERGVEFASLQEALDTTTSGGRFIFHLFASLAELEQELIRERTMAGLQAARARGRKGGRAKKLSERDVYRAKCMLMAPEITVTEVARTLGVSRTTLYRYLEPGDTEVKEKSKM